MSVDLKILTPDASINDSAVLFGADSQASASPSVYSVSTLRAHIQSVGFPDGSTAAPSITNEGDLNTGFWFPAADTIAASTAGTEHMRITSAGNVGIGTSSPSQKLTVNGSVATNSFILLINQHLIYDPDATNIAIRIGAAGPFYTIGTTGSNNLRLNNSSGGDILFAQAGTERMRITSAGNVGIGTITFGTSASKVLALGNATAPTTGPADTIQIYSTDLSAGNTMLSLYTEGTPVNANTTAATTHRIAIRVNGTVYYLLANTAA